MKLGVKTIQINFDIEDDRPHKALRLYDVNGNAIGRGIMVTKKVDPESNLFETTAGYVIYSATIDLDALIEKEEQVKRRATKTVTKTEEPDVEDTDDPEEDNWVRGALKQAKDAKVKVDLLYVNNLREEYRKMMHARAKSNDKDTEVFSETKETEPDKEIRDIKNDILKDSQEEEGIGKPATYYGDMPDEFIGDELKEEIWRKHKETERKKVIDKFHEDFQKRMDKDSDKSEISLDDL